MDSKSIEALAAYDNLGEAMNKNKGLYPGDNTLFAEEVKKAALEKELLYKDLKETIIEQRDESSIDKWMKEYRKWGESHRIKYDKNGDIIVKEQKDTRSSREREIQEFRGNMKISSIAKIRKILMKHELKVLYINNIEQMAKDIEEALR